MKIDEWADKVLENERLASYYHLGLGILALLGAAWHLGWAYRRHKRALSQQQTGKSASSA